MADSESEYLYKEACEDCSSSDGKAVYSDGHTYCFVCLAHHRGAGEPTRSTPRVARDFEPLHGDIRETRGLTEETLRKFNYTTTSSTGEWLQVANYYKAGQLSAQHTRTTKKEFKWRGDSKGVELFGQHLWGDGGRKVVVTEGELDAMSVSQMQGNKWPVVSVPSGAASARKALQANLEWLEKYDEVILMFDMDDPGQDAAAECAALFTPGKCKVARLPLKDANEMLQEHRGDEIIRAIWDAKSYRPDGVVTVSDVIEAASKDLEEGTPWFLPTLTKVTHGRRPGELYAFGAGTGVGKTDWFTQSIAYDIEQGVPVGVLYLEQPPVETVRRIAGKLVGKLLHIPGRVSTDERRAALEALSATGLLHLYDHFGSTEWTVIKAKLRYMVVALNCRHIYLDHLTALVAHEEDERKALDLIMAELAGMAQELGCIIHFISHLTRPEGKPHEEGGRVQLRNFRGSNAIGMWSHGVYGIERNQQAETVDEKATIFRVLKDRNTGQATGKTIALSYDPETGLIAEADELSPFPDNQGSPF